MKRYFHIFIILILLFACDSGRGLRRSNIDNIINIIENYDENFEYNQSELEDYILLEINDNVSNEDYLFDFYIGEDKKIYEAYFESYGRTNKDFIYNICINLINHEQSSGRIKKSLKDLIYSSTGGTYQFKNDYLEINIDMKISGSSFHFISLRNRGVNDE